MIEFISKGDIFESGCEALVNPVNCVGVMGAGLAREFKKRYPTNFGHYQYACDCGEVVPGKMFITFRQEPLPRYIVNFPTKRDWRHESQLSDIDMGLTALIVDINRYGIGSIAIPALGCGRGGLFWETVSPRIKEALEPLTNVHVKIYEPSRIL